MKLIVRTADAGDLDQAAALFDAYRQYYCAAPDLAGARRFLEERMRLCQSAVLLAMDGERAVGFAQLYPSFSSLAVAPIWVLNDLFVTPEARGAGVGRALLASARDLAVATGARRIVLETARTNTGAQRLYESLGYRCENEAVRFYALELGEPVVIQNRGAEALK